MQQKKADKKISIINAATELFSEKGFHDVKLSEVARRANVGKGTIYTYFASKDELLIQCLLYGIPAYEKKVDQALAAKLEFKETFKKLIALRYELVQKKGPLISQFMALGPQLRISDKEYRSLIEVFEKSMSCMAGFFQQAIDAKILGDSLTAGQMAIMFQQIFDLNVLCKLYKEPTLKQEEVFDFLFNGFGQKRSK